MLERIKKIAEKVDVRLSKQDLEDIDLYLGWEMHMIQSDLDIPENEKRVANIILGIAKEK